MCNFRSVAAAAASPEPPGRRLKSRHGNGDIRPQRGPPLGRSAGAASERSRFEANSEGIPQRPRRSHPSGRGLGREPAGLDGERGRQCLLVGTRQAPLGRHGCLRLCEGRGVRADWGVAFDRQSDRPPSADICAPSAQPKLHLVFQISPPSSSPAEALQGRFPLRTSMRYRRPIAGHRVTTRSPIQAAETDDE